MIQPLNNNVILEVAEDTSSIYIPDEVKKKPEVGVVVSSFKNSSVKKGDNVMFKKYTPDEIEVDGKKYLSVKEENIIAILEDTNIEINQSEPTPEEQREIYKDEILQPYTKDNKINADFIKRYGKEKHPSFNNK